MMSVKIKVLSLVFLLYHKKKNEKKKSNFVFLFGNGRKCCRAGYTTHLFVFDFIF